MQLANLKREPGLGLKICWVLAQLHGGELTIESEPNQGTTVTVVFKD